MAGDTFASFFFLPRSSRWQKEKPYTLKFQPAKEFPVTSEQRVEVKDILVKDIRGQEPSFSLERNGFAVMQLKELGMTYEDFSDDAKVKSVFLKAVAEELQTYLGASRVQIFDVLIRKSHAQFPISTGERFPYTQPANIMHIDAMPIEGDAQVRRLNPQNADRLMGRRFQYVNVWKPLLGPVENWPLAVCDRSSIDFSNDIVNHDSVFPESLIETGEIHASKEHKFYYLGDQQVDEALLLLQTDSILGYGVPHASFEVPCASKAGKTRESIEIRSMVYY